MSDQGSAVSCDEGCEAREMTVMNRKILSFSEYKAEVVTDSPSLGHLTSDWLPFSTSRWLTRTAVSDKNTTIKVSFKFIFRHSLSPPHYESNEGWQEGHHCVWGDLIRSREDFTVREQTDQNFHSAIQATWSVKVNQEKEENEASGNCKGESEGENESNSKSETVKVRTGEDEGEDETEIL